MMQAAAYPPANGFQEALAEALRVLGERFETDMRMARRELGERLNQAVRRMRQAEGENAWSRALVEAASGFAGRAALFAVEDRALRLLATAGLDATGAPASVPLDSAAAFASVADSGEPAVALRNSAEMSVPLAQVLKGETHGKFHLFPILADERVAAILYVDTNDAETDSSVLEVLASAGGAALDAGRRRWKKHAGFVDLLRMAAATGAPKSWEDLSPADRQWHWKAQRMARSRVAEIRLYCDDEVRLGRGDKNLYGVLKERIDAAREEFRREYLGACGSMVDYLHLELVRTIANDDVELLGPGYPGPSI